MCVMQAAQQVLVAVQTEYQAKQEREAGDAAERMANNNAKLAEQQAQDSATLAARESQQSIWSTRSALGQQGAAIAGAGINSDSGTAADIMDETALFGGANLSAIAQDAARNAWGFQAEALQHRNAGKLAKWEGHQKAKFTKLNGAMQSLNIWSGGSMMGGGVQGQQPGGVQAQPVQTYQPRMSQPTYNYGRIGYTPSYGGGF